VRSRVLRSRLREQFFVTTKDGASFHGLLYSCDEKALVLRNAEAVGAGENQTNLPLDGEIIILLRDVAYLQRP
jgi:small nuclear ribonucleoprotein (snRNP)-like protein